jgi:hypothetical protein
VEEQIIRVLKKHEPGPETADQWLYIVTHPDSA